MLHYDFSTVSARTDSYTVYPFTDNDDTHKRVHPAIFRSHTELLKTMLRVLLVSIAITLASFMAGCATVTDHRDGGGYTVRYAGFDTPPATARPKRKGGHQRKSVQTVFIEETPINPTFLNVGRDDEIPVENAKFVSSRGITTWRARLRMCNASRPGYCASPNVPHCHGSFCHAHSGGANKHTH
jgi:hypothetical protein